MTPREPDRRSPWPPHLRLLPSWLHTSTVRTDASRHQYQHRELPPSLLVPRRPSTPNQEDELLREQCCRAQPEPCPNAISTRLQNPTSSMPGHLTWVLPLTTIYLCT